MRVSQGFFAFRKYQDYRLEMGIIRQPTHQELHYLVDKIEPIFPDREIEELLPEDFRKVLIVLSKRWGSARLRRVRHFLGSWLRYLADEGLIASVPITGRLETPTYRPRPKDIYSPEEINRIWNAGHDLCRMILGLGLYAGLNPSDLVSLRPQHIAGQWLIQPRVKTNAPRRVHLPSHLVSLLERHGLPLRTRVGVLDDRNRISGLWRDWTRRSLGASKAFTGLRTTLRTIGGEIDPEAVEIAILGHQGATAAKVLGRSTVSLSHYVNPLGISDARLRRLTRATTTYAHKPYGTTHGPISRATPIRHNPPSLDPDPIAL